MEIRLGGGDFIKEKSSQIGFLEVNAQGMATSQRGHVTRRMEENKSRNRCQSMNGNQCGSAGWQEGSLRGGSIRHLRFQAGGKDGLLADRG